MKKGQVTVFIILALVIIAGVVIFFISKDSKKVEGGDSISDSQLNSIREGVSQCVELSTIDGIRLVGLQGGYIFLPENSVKTNFSNIAYGYYNGRNTLPSLNTIQGEIASYVDMAFPLCFDEEKFQQVNITSSRISSKVKIYDSYVSILMDYPLSVSNEDSTVLLKESYESKIPIRMGLIHKEASNIIQKEIETPSYIDLTSLASSEYEVAILPYSSSILIYSITDNSSQIGGVPYTFMFANRLR